jgi:large repetitive protein
MKRTGSGNAAQKQRPAPWLLSSLTGSAILLAAPAAWAGVITPSPAFDPINVIQGQKSVYTLTLGNDDITAAAGLKFSVTLPAGVTLSGANQSNTCGGTLSAAANSPTFGITGGNLLGRVGATDGKCEIKLEMVGTAGGNQIVVIPAGAITSTPGITNTQAGNATLQVTGLSAVDTQVIFNPSPLPQGLASLFTLKFSNGNSIPLTGMTFPNITLPPGLKIAPGTQTNLCGGTLLAAAGALGFSLSNATIAPGGCEISFYWEGVGPITGSSQDFNFAFPGGTITTDNTVSNTAGSGTLTIIKDLRVSQAFNRGDVFTDEASALTVSFENAGTIALTNAALTLNLPGGLTIADTTTATTCGGTVTAVAGDTKFIFAGGTIPAATLASLGKCDLQINAVSATAATYTSTININQVTNTQASNNINLSKADLLVQNVVPITGVGIGVGVKFTAPVVSANNVSRMSIDLSNDTGLNLTGISSGTGIQLPTGLVLAATPNPTTTCPGGIATVAGTDILKLDGVSLTRRAKCTVEVDVISQTPAVYTQNVVAKQFTSAQNRFSVAASGSLEVIDFINLQQSFDSSVVAASASGNKTKMKLRLSNAANAASLATQLKFSLALGLKFVGGVTSNACGGTLTLTAGGTAFDLSGATIPAKTGPAIGQDGFCDIEYDVLATGAAGTINQNIPVSALTNGAGQTNRKPVNTPLTLADVEVVLNQQILNRTPGDLNNGKPIVKGGDPAELIVTLKNSSGIGLTNLGFPNTLGAGMIVYPDPNPSSTCAGTPVITATPSAPQYTVSGINLAAGASCQVKLMITSLLKGNTDNVITAKAITSTEGGTNPAEARTTLTVEGNATLSKSFTPLSIAPGGKATLKLSVINANNIPLTNAEVVDNLPAGMVLADVPNLQTNCVGTVTASAGGSAVSLKAGVLANNSICSISADVTSLTSGSYTNLLKAGTLKTAEAYTNDRDISAILTVVGASIERPDLKLVKRITQITNPAATPGGTPEVIALNGNFNVTPATGRDDDNAPGWPLPIGASGISTYLKGATNETQIAQLGNVKSGSEVEYTGYFLAEGTGDAKKVVLCDFVPAKTTFVPGSIQAGLDDGSVIAATNATFVTANFPAACQGTNSGNGAVVITVGDLVKSTGAGIPKTSYGFFKFRVKVN